jgi:hypothetical protein
MSEARPLTSALQVREFALAGNATLTIVSKRTGSRFTYKIRVPEENTGRLPIHFVSVLTGNDNEESYRYLGQIKTSVAGDRYEYGRKSKIAPSAPSAIAFDWTWQKIVSNELPDSVEIWHEGKCGRCGRKLTVPESIESGFGPECINKIGFG